MVLGIYYLTMGKMIDYSNDPEKASQALETYETYDELRRALDAGTISGDTLIRFVANEQKERFLADLILCAVPFDTNSFITKGLNNSIAISFGRPH